MLSPSHSAMARARASSSALAARSCPPWFARLRHPYLLPESCRAPRQIGANALSDNVNRVEAEFGVKDSDCRSLFRRLAGRSPERQSQHLSRSNGYLAGAGSDDDTFIRWLGNKIFTFLLRLMYGVRLTDALFFYALGKKEVFESLDLESTDFSICVEIPIKVHKRGYKYTEIPLTERQRIAGVSKVNAAWDGLRILAAMVKFKLKGY